MVSSASVESTQLTAAPVSEDTAAPEIETLPTETAAPVTEATATATADEQTETEDPLATFEEDTLRKSARVKAMLEANARDVTAGIEGRHRQEIEAARAESERQTNAAAYERQQQELVEVDNGAAVSALYDALNAVVDRNIDPEAVQRLEAQLPALGEMAKTLTRTTQTRVDRGYVEGTNEYLTANFPEYRIAPETVAKFDAALARGDFKARHQIELDIVAEAAVVKATPGIRTAAVRDLKTEAEKTQQLTEQRAAEKVAAANGGPTNVAGRPAATGGNYRSVHEAELLHIAGKISNPEMLRVRELNQRHPEQMPYN